MEKLFKKFNFTHYPNAYSIYATTIDSIPSYLNFYYEYNYDELKNSEYLMRIHIYFMKKLQTIICLIFTILTKFMSTKT